MSTTPSIDLIPYLQERSLPYRKLWVKVIIRAVYDYKFGMESPDKEVRNEARRARAWLYSENDEDSLESVCSLLNLSSESIRNVIEKISKEDLKRLRLTDSDGVADFPDMPEVDNEDD